MPTQLKKDWIPDEVFFWDNNANKHAMTNYGSARAWALSHLHEFKMYWCKKMGGNGKPMTSWDLTYWNRCKVLWERVDKSRMYREEVNKEKSNGNHETIIIQKGDLAELHTRPPSAEALSIARFEKQCEEYLK
jgi:phosphoserine aminotransferase